MKLNKYIYWAIFMAFGTAIVSCGDEDDVIPFNEAANDISFPDYPAFSASFTMLDDVILDINVAGPTTSLDVSSAEANFGSVAISGGTGNFTRTLADLGYQWTDEDGDPVNTLEIAFAAPASQRLFDLSVTNPITSGFTVGEGDDAVDFASATMVNLDSSYSIYFEAETKNGIIDNYQIFTKVGSEADFPTTPAVEETINGLEISEASVTLEADSAIVNIGDTIYYQVIANRGSLSASISGTVRVVEVPLTETETITLRTPDFIIEEAVLDTAGMVVTPAVLDSLNNAFNFSALKVIADSVLMDSPDSADVRLTLIAGELAFEAGAGSNTEYVVAGPDFSFASATYESVRDAYNASMSTTTTVIDIESLDTNAVVLVRIGNIPNEDYPSADNKRYAAIQISGFTKEDAGITSEVTFDYKAPTQAD